MTKTLLVPVDGSHSSLTAVKFAGSMLNEDDQIIILNVQKPQYEGFNKMTDISKEDLDAYYNSQGEMIVKKVIEEFPKIAAKAEMIVKLGLPAIEITKLAKERNVHSIIMGSKGVSQVVNNALGSVTYSVLHLAACPVTIVPYENN